MLCSGDGGGNMQMRRDITIFLCRFACRRIWAMPPAPQMRNNIPGISWYSQQAPPLTIREVIRKYWYVANMMGTDYRKWAAANEKLLRKIKNWNVFRKNFRLHEKFCVKIWRIHLLFRQWKGIFDMKRNEARKIQASFFRHLTIRFFEVTSNQDGIEKGN